MYNTKNTNNSNVGPYKRKSEPLNQQLQQQKSTSQPPFKGPITRGSRSQSQIQTLELQTLEPNTVEVILPSKQDNQNIMIKLETDTSVEESIEEKPEVKWPPKRKLNKKEQKKRLNARMRRLVCPKSPLMVFTELYKDVPIKLDETTHNNCIIFTASFEIDGQLYSGDHVSKTQAKQKACENFLRGMLSKKITEPIPSSDKKEIAENVMEVEENENTNIVKPKGPPQEDFPWPHFASLAMHNLISHWDIQTVPKTAQEVTSGKPAAKASGMKKFPPNPENYNPVQLLHQMSPGIKFNEITLNSSSPSLFEANCELNGAKFVGQGPTKKAAKKESAIAAIKYVWGFDFHTIDKK